MKSKYTPPSVGRPAWLADTIEALNISMRKKPKNKDAQEAWEAEALAKINNKLSKVKSGYKTNPKPPSAIWDLSTMHEKISNNNKLVRYIDLKLNKTKFLPNEVNDLLDELRAIVDSIMIQTTNKVSHYQITLVQYEEHVKKSDMSSTFQEDARDCIDEVKAQIKKKSREYERTVGDATWTITKVTISYILDDNSIILGGRTVQQAQEIWYEPDQRTITNCLFIALYTALHPTKRVLTDTQYRREATKRWKMKLAIANSIKECPDSSHLPFLAKALNITIVVYDNMYVKTNTYAHGDKTIEIRISNGHATPLIRKANLDFTIPPIMVDSIIQPPEYGRPIKSKPKEAFEFKKIAAWDIETTDSFDAYMVSLGFYNPNIHQNELVQWSSTDPLDNVLQEFADYLYEHRKFFDGYVLYAHNGGKFDLVLLMRDVLLNDTRFKIHTHKAIEIHNSWINMGIVMEDATVWFRDSYRMVQASLKNITKEYNVVHQKIEMDIRYKDLTDVQKDLEKIKEYNKYDTLGLLEVMQTFNHVIYDTFRVNATSCLTAASLAKRVLLSCYCPSGMMYTLPEELDRKFRKAYWGGRNECFRLGVIDGPVYCYDFTSLYPFTGTFPLPHGEPREIHSFEEIGVRACGILKVRIQDTDQSRTHIPAQCYLYNDRLNFPRFTSWTEIDCTIPEYHYGLKLGYEYEFIEGYIWPSTNYLAEYFQDLFKMKQEAGAKGQSAAKSVFKILVNSGYGNLGFNPYNKDTVKISSKDSNMWRKFLKDGKLLAHGVIGEYGFTRVLNTTRTECNVVVAAHITAYARIQLHKLMTDIVRKGGELYYCDTDSVMTNYCIEKDPELMKAWMPDGTGEGLGYIKNECPDKTHFDKMVIAGCKMYSLIKGSHEINKLKGYQKRSDSPLSSLVILQLFDQIHPVRNAQESIVVNKTSYTSETNKFNLKSQICHKLFQARYEKGYLLPIPGTSEEAPQFSILPLEVSELHLEPDDLPTSM